MQTRLVHMCLRTVSASVRARASVEGMSHKVLPFVQFQGGGWCFLPCFGAISRALRQAKRQEKQEEKRRVGAFGAEVKQAVSETRKLLA